MHALILSTNGEDYVHIAATREKLDKKAIDLIKNEIDLDSATWENFGTLEVERLFLEALEAGEVDSAMELFADISDARGEMVFMRIVPAELDLDS